MNDRAQRVTHGKIKHWDDEKAYGFIEPTAGGKDVFVHINAFLDKRNPPEVGQLVSYSLSKDKDGRLCAAKVRKPSDNMRQKKRRKSGMPSLLIAMMFLVVVATTVYLNLLTINILYLYLAVSGITYIVYALDKSSAQTGGWRTKESTLHLLALVGGWPGALIAQQRLRHKSQKQNFRLVCWLTVLINIAAFCCLFTDNGQTLEAKIGSWGGRSDGLYIEWSENE